MSAVLPILQNLVKPLTEAADKLTTSKEEKLAFLSNMQRSLVEASASVITAEAQSDSWITRSWRPILMLVGIAIIANNYILAPYLAAFFGWSIKLDIPPDLWSLLKIGVGGYVGARTIDKAVVALTSTRRSRRHDKE